ncbi:hypothetical protein DFH07DRAFT_780324 [Mycena maculata]|uniref:Uncharacterized protein n=1 Tax=Mycena maculata TaxID=230809 RepID=A0AAD7I3N1_9AGAR|nr:hypothetical protein DFH07DRAFT_780324 [Mycena maculata]
MCGVVPHNTSVWPACHICICTGPLGLASSGVHKYVALNAIDPAPALGIQDQCQPPCALGMVLVFLSHLLILRSFYFSQNDFVSIFAVGQFAIFFLVSPAPQTTHKWDKAGRRVSRTSLVTLLEVHISGLALSQTKRLRVEKIHPLRKQKSKKRDQETNEEDASPSRQSTPDLTPSTDSTIHSTTGSGTELRAIPMSTKPIHPMFWEKVTRPDTDEDITELLSVPHIPIIIPDSLGTGNNIPVPPHLSDPSTPLTEILNTGDPEACDPEDTQAPEGIVKLFLEEMLAAVKDQTERHGQPECDNKHKTFWILQPDLWFTLEEYKYTPTLLSPEPLYCPQVFV